MPLKRKDVSKPSTRHSSIPRPLPNKLKFSPLRFISRIIRTSICVFALYALYKRYNPSPLEIEPSHLRQEEEGRERYEVIQVDEYKRDRILDAFKVRSSSLLYSLDWSRLTKSLCLWEFHSIPTQLMKEMHSDSTSSSLPLPLPLPPLLPFSPSHTHWPLWALFLVSTPSLIQVQTCLLPDPSVTSSLIHSIHSSSQTSLKNTNAHESGWSRR